ncbi:MAG: hypothetical protein PUC23_03605 [bacterium]|nr:hypothetical protein [bacterium]
MNTEKSFMKYGFINDVNNAKLKEIFKDGTKIREIHMDIYPDNPIDNSMLFMLLLRTIEKNVLVTNDDNRIILKKNDKYKTCFVNVLLSKITECFFRTFENCIEFILNIHNTYYRVTILN